MKPLIVGALARAFTTAQAQERLSFEAATIKVAAANAVANPVLSPSRIACPSPA